MKPALLVVDVQRKFFDINPIMTQSLNNAVEYINPAIVLCREKGLPVMAIQHMHKESELMPGEEGFDLPDALDIVSNDMYIHKTYGNAFNKTTLAAELSTLDVDTVIVTGFCAEHCVLSTYHGAQDLDLTPHPTQRHCQQQSGAHHLCGKHQRPFNAGSVKKSISLALTRAEECS